MSLLIIAGAATLPARAQPDAALSAAVAQQIAMLLAAKESRSPAEQKVDSNLLYAAMQQAGQTSGALDTIDTGVDIGPDQLVEVDVTAQVSDGLLARIRALGGQIVASYPDFHSLRAELPIAQLTTIAGWDDVIFVQPPQQGETAGRIQGPTLALAKTNSSEGDVAHRADQLRATYGFTGAGVKVCVLSDGVNSLASLQAAGDLPAVTVLPGQAGSGDEGSAMLEIVHDLAPDAQLFFASAFGGIGAFAQNIRALRSTYGCDIIIDDVTYYAESPFQLGQAPAVISTRNAGIVSEAVDGVTTDGALFFTSAGNAGNLSDGTAGVWEGDFASAGPATSPIPVSGEVLDFNPGTGMQGYDTITSAGNFLTLAWADPLGGSSNDYDLFLLSSGGALVGQSTNIQSGTQDAYEQISVAQEAGDRVVVVRRAGAASRYLRVNTNGGALQFATDGQIYGHHANTGAGVFAVAASPAYGAYPGAFSAASLSEDFSSDGPRRHFFAADGTPFTPGNFSSTGGQVAQKPDLTAADGVSCAAPKFNPFYGTSAAAPHAGALAALLLSGRPTLTQAQMRTLLTTAPGAIDIENVGIDRTTGAGVLDALGLAQSLGKMTGPLLTFANLKVVEGSRANGNGRVEPGESAYITAQVANPTLAAASDVQLSFTITSPTSGVQVISQPVAAGTIAASSSYSLAAQRAIVSIAPSVACGTQISYQITASYGGSGSNSPQSVSASFTLGGGASCSAAPPQPASIAMAGGSSQAAFVGQPFGAQLQATVRDSNGDPAPDVLVSFSAPGSGAGATFPAGSSAVSDAGGRASVAVRANGTIGSYSVTASISGAASVAPASFSLTNRAGVLLPLLAR